MSDQTQSTGITSKSKSTLVIQLNMDEGHAQYLRDLTQNSMGECESPEAAQYRKNFFQAVTKELQQHGKLH